MFCRSLQTAVAIALAIAGLAHAQEPPLPDAKQFLAESMRRLRSNDLLRSRYTFTEEETRYTYDSSGRVVKTQHRVYEIRPSFEPELTYRRLVSVNRVPQNDLAKRDAEHQKKVQEWTAARESEGQNAREARLRREAEEDRAEQAVVDELTGDLRLPHDGPRDRSTDGPRSSSRSSRGRPTARGRRRAGSSRVSAGGHGSTSRIANWCG